MIIGEDFEFADSIKSDTAAIRLLTGPYNGVVYRYTQMSVKENDDDSATLMFDYELFEMKDFTETSLRSDQRFTQHIGLVLNTLILEAVDQTLNTDGSNNESRSTNTEESNQ